MPFELVIHPDSILPKWMSLAAMPNSETRMLLWTIGYTMEQHGVGSAPNVGLKQVVDAAIYASITSPIVLRMWRNDFKREVSVDHIMKVLKTQPLPWRPDASFVPGYRWSAQ